MLWGFDCCFLYRKRVREKWEYFLVFRSFCLVCVHGEARWAEHRGKTFVKYTVRSGATVDGVIGQSSLQLLGGGYGSNCLQNIQYISTLYSHHYHWFFYTNKTMAEKFNVSKSSEWKRYCNCSSFIDLYENYHGWPGHMDWCPLLFISCFIKMTAVDFISQQRGNRRSG